MQGKRTVYKCLPLTVYRLCTVSCSVEVELNIIACIHDKVYFVFVHLHFYSRNCLERNGG